LTGRQLKIERLIDEYDLVDLGAELERCWTAEGDERSSLRDLTDHFNRRVPESAMEAAEMQALPGKVANLYELLTGDEASDANRTRVVRRLECVAHHLVVAVPRRVRHEDAAPGGRSNIDVVVADVAANNEAQVLQGLDHPLCE